MFAQTVHFKHVLLGFQCVALMAMLLTAIFVGTNPLFTETAVGINALTLIISIVSIAAITGPASRVHFLAIIFYYEFFVTPLFNLLLFPGNFYRGYSNINLPPIKATDINNTSLALLIGMVAMCVGIHLGATGQSGHERPQRSKRAPLPLGPVLLVCLGVVGCQIGANIFWGVGRAWTVVAVNHHTLQIFYLLIESETATIMATVALIANWQSSSGRIKTIGSGVVFCLWMIRVLEGTKAGIHYGAYTLLIMFLFYSPTVRFRASRLATTAVILAMLAPLSFIAGAVARTITFHQDLNSQVVTPGEWAHLILANPEGQRVESNLATDMLSRVNGFDSTTLVIHGLGEGVTLPLSNVAKSTINMLIPGHVWLDILPSARMFGVMYGTETAFGADEHYHTDIWYLFGMLYGTLGLPMGAFGIALSMMLFTQLYRKMIEPRVATSCGIIFPYFIALYGLGLYWWMSSQGFDAWVAFMAYYAVHGALYLGAAVLLSRLYALRSSRLERFRPQ